MASSSRDYGERRRDMLLSVATELFRSRGYDRVGVAEIGAAAGISGPGVYRHFASKDAVLVAIFDEVAERLVRASQRIVADEPDPAATLRALVGFHVDFALRDRAVVAVYYQEQRNLPAEDRRRIRRRQRTYLARWTETLLALRPELGGPEALALVHAAINVVLSATTYESELDPDRLGALLVDRAVLVLRSPGPSPDPRPGHRTIPSKVR